MAHFRHGIRPDAQFFHAIIYGLQNCPAIVVRSAGDLPRQDMPAAGQEDNIGEGAADVHAYPVIHHIDHALNSVDWRGA